MIKRIIAILLVVSLLSCFPLTALACDEEQSNIYVMQILFGDGASFYENDADVQKLLDALYICSEQSDKDGQEKLNSLKKAKVGGVPTLAKIKVNGEDLFECSHNGWEKMSAKNSTAQKARKDFLRKVIVKVFNFGWFNELFRKESGQIDSFAALLYYSHILADYLADDPMDTAVSVNGYDIPAYSGIPYIELNNGRPTFTKEEKKCADSYMKFSEFDSFERTGTAFVNVGPETLAPSDSRPYIGNIKPSGWNQQKYDGIVNSSPPYLYNRCHLVAHQLANVDEANNLITGTRYLNKAMIPYEDQVADYVKNTGNQVLYRATPVYVGTNAVASGVQLEAYSVEDHGKGLSFNVYLYNVQPGVDIDYANGSSKLADDTIHSDDFIPFAVDNPSKNNSDLMYEIREQLEILFVNQKNNSDYTTMMGELDLVADAARNVSGNKDWQVYSALKRHQYEYMQVLIQYVPKLLSNEKFFTSAFGK